MTNFQREVNFTKNILLFFIFIGLVLYVFFSIVSENIKKYKDKNKQIKKSQSELILYNKDYDELYQKYNQKIKDNAFNLKAMHNAYNEVEISKLLNKYFRSFELSIKSKSHIKNYEVLNIQVKSTTTTPQNFYLFVNKLTRVSNLVEIAHPLKFKSSNGYLKVDFMLKVYTFD